MVEITLMRMCCDFINQFNDEHNVDHLNLRIMETTASDPVNALLSFSSRVRLLYPNQYFISANHWTYMFGLQNVEWADIILAMLGRDMKLETLRINGMDVPRCLHLKAKKNSRSSFRNWIDLSPSKATTVCIDDLLISWTEDTLFE
ncbi:hypothetical protein PMAYCL1PPCAC_20517, partial [Pristionchus mayeri]